MSPIIWATMITSLSTSTIITLNSHHWLLAWLGLELNTLSILPITMKPHHPRATEATTKYFLVQTLSAALILFASTLNAWQTGHWTITNASPQTTTITATAVMMKLGAAPVHLWYPEILQGATLNTALIISTWQKIAPLALLYMIHSNLPTNFLLLAGLLSALVGGWGGLNQTQTRKIMAHSSIAHMGWILIALTISPQLATLTLMTYITMTISMFTTLNKITAKTIIDLGTAWTASPAMTAFTLLTLASLGGLPLLTGFMPKLLILHDLTKKSLLPLATLLVMAGLPSLFFYVRLAYTIALTIPPNPTTTKFKWRLMPHQSHTTPPALVLALMLLPLTAALYTTT
uniref:NADH-ubiquinone oxidoreductase chain 2 n=1 Tax=Gehyra sp. MPH-2011 TaxID=1127071 RepID=G9HTN8_9SAUR|nr:NADH dehydrogenase subunit 2 [Gehyra sp. MPH-2011]